MNQFLFPALAFLYTALLLLFSTVPVETVPGTGATLPRMGDLDHFLSYLLYGFLLSLSLSKKRYHPLIIGIFIGILTEFMQIFIPSRTFDPLDMVSNILGVAVGIVLVITLRKRFQNVKHAGKTNAVL